MSPTGTKLSEKKALFQPKRLSPGLHVAYSSYSSQSDGEEREPLVADGSNRLPSLRPLSSLSSKTEVRCPPRSDLDGETLSKKHARIAQEILPPLLSHYPLLNPHDAQLNCERPVAAGGFADIWEATYAGRKVVLKSYRCYMSFDVAQIATRFRNEVYACNLLSGTDSFLIGMYSTDRHPFGLLYEYMGGLDLKQYLTNRPNVEKLKLLTDIAQGLKHMHDLDIVHGGVHTANILVDKDGAPHIAGLGNAYILPRPPLSTLKSWKFTWPGTSTRVGHITLPTKSSDIYTFGVMAFEIFTGQPVFHEMSRVAAMNSMLNGSRPPRPDQVSEFLWRVIQSCWSPKEPRRMRIEKVVALLEAERVRTTNTDA